MFYFKLLVISFDEQIAWILTQYTDQMYIYV